MDNFAIQANRAYEPYRREALHCFWADAAVSAAMLLLIVATHLYQASRIICGGGYGKSVGISYSVGLVDNFNEPTDYSGDFFDVNACNSVGLDHCCDPTREYATTTRATSITFADGISYGVGYDYYSPPAELIKWR